MERKKEGGRRKEIKDRLRRTSREPLATSETDETARVRRNRPSTERGSGSNPEPPCAFEVSMIKVSCNSH